VILSGQYKVAETEVPLVQERETLKDAWADASASASGLDTFSTIIMKVINKTYAALALAPADIPPEIIFEVLYI
jgi:hypothetical protein